MKSVHDCCHFLCIPDYEKMCSCSYHLQSTGDYDAEPSIRCIEKGCKGLIVPTWVQEDDEIYWGCIHCKTKGIVTDWRGTKWDNSSEA